MIGTGEGLAIFGVCGTIIAAIAKFVPKRNGNGVVSKELCNERHDRIGLDILEVKESINTVNTTLTEILLQVRK